MACSFPPKLFGQWLDGRIDNRNLIEQLLTHLAALCPTCRRNWLDASRLRTPGAALWFRELQREAEAEGLAAQEAIARAIRFVQEQKKGILHSRETSEAGLRVEQLLALPQPQREGEAALLPSDATSLEISRLLLRKGRQWALARSGSAPRGRSVPPPRCLYL